MIDAQKLKPVVWMGSAKRDFDDFPERVKDEMGFALYLAQRGERHLHAKTFSGAGDAGIVEIVEDDRAGTYRTVYAVRFGSAVYVLHAFQKKSKSGIATPKSDIDLIERRLKDAKRLHEESKNGQTH
jgi:phage-related protein